MFGKLINIFSVFIFVQRSLVLFILQYTFKRDAKLTLNRRREIYTFKIFERIRRVPRHSGEIYCGHVARIKPVSRQRDIVIRRLINRDL